MIGIWGGGLRQSGAVSDTLRIYYTCLSCDLQLLVTSGFYAEGRGQEREKTGESE